jgi:hypothetical protein
MRAPDARRQRYQNVEKPRQAQATATTTPQTQAARFARFRTAAVESGHHSIVMPKQKHARDDTYVTTTQVTQRFIGRLSQYFVLPGMRYSGYFFSSFQA